MTGIALSDGDASLKLQGDNNTIDAVHIGTDISGIISTGANHKINLSSANNSTIQNSLFHLGSEAENCAAATVFASNNNNFSNNIFNFDPNTEQFACNHGILVNENSKNNTFRENRYLNVGKIAIDLQGGYENDFYSTSNDSGDTDGGANDLQNYPTISAVTFQNDGKYLITGDLYGAAGEAPWTIEVCETSRHWNKHGDCLRSFGTTQANSPWEKSIHIDGDDGTEERYFTALATNNWGSTSEFGPIFGINTRNTSESITVNSINETETTLTPIQKQISSLLKGAIKGLETNTRSIEEKMKDYFDKKEDVKPRTQELRPQNVESFEDIKAKNNHNFFRKNFIYLTATAAIAILIAIFFVFKRIIKSRN